MSHDLSRAGLRVRVATTADAAVIAGHRASMFADLGRLPPETFEALRVAAEHWAAAERLDRLVLQASDQGRRLYQRLGFVPTNEMRFVEPTVPDRLG